MKEIWKPVPSLKGLLVVSSNGKVRRLERPLVYKDGRKGKLKSGMLSGYIGATGYRVVSFGLKKFYVHRLIAETFLPPQKDEFAYRTVNHKNGNKLDNRPENIEWATFKENNNHARRTGLNKQHGENTNLSKYSDKFIQSVRNVHREYGPNWEKLGGLFGITGCHARQIVLKLTRKN